MKTFPYRVAQLVTNDQLMPDGGIGVTVRSLNLMFQDMGYAVDVITDCLPHPTDDKRVNFREEIERTCTRIVTRDHAIPYTRFRHVHSNKPGINLEESANMRESLVKAFERTVYDLIIIHNPNTIPAVYDLDIWRNINCVTYTHDPKNVFPNNDSNSIINYQNTLYKLPGITVGTHTAVNQRHVALPNCVILPLPLPDSELLTSTADERTGVLYIGKWEHRKDPQAYCAMIKRTGLPARIITSPHSLNKFKQEFKRLAHTGDVVYALEQYPQSLIRGYSNHREKREFIAQCRVAYLPYKVESYGLAIDEALAQMPVVLSHCAGAWSEHFVTSNRVYQGTDYADCERQVVEWHDADTVEGDCARIQAQQLNCRTQWHAQLGIQAVGQAAVPARVSTYTHIWHSDWHNKMRRDIDKFDIQSLLNAKHNHTRYYTQSDCYYSKDGAKPEDPQTVEMTVGQLQQWSQAL